MASSPKSGASRGRDRRRCVRQGGAIVQLCDAHDLPIISLTDTPGFMVGPDAERQALVRRACRMFVNGATVTVPYVTVVCARATGWERWPWRAATTTRRFSASRGRWTRSATWDSKEPCASLPQGTRRVREIDASRMSAAEARRTGERDVRLGAQHCEERQRPSPHPDGSTRDLPSPSCRFRTPSRPRGKRRSSLVMNG